MIPTPMTALVDHDTHPEHVEALPPKSRGFESAGWWRTAGCLLVVSVVVYSILRLEDGTTSRHAASVAVLIAFVWLPFLRWSTQAARAMPLAFGPFSVAAASAALGFVATSAIAFLIPALDVRPVNLVAIAVITFALSAVWEASVRRAALAPDRVLLVGGGESAAELIEDVRRESQRFRIVGVVVDDRGMPLGEASPYVVSSLGDAIETLAPNLVVVAVDRGRPEVFQRLLDSAYEDFRMVGLPEFYEVAFGKLPVRELTPAWFMSTLHLYNRPYNRSAKRAFDFVAASIGMLAALPVLPLIALLVKLTPGPLLYKQTRLGEHGREFTILKFRSMRPEAEKDGDARWAAHDDPRIIPGGRLLRKARLDEIPQLWNVLRGDMSIVGPRPERPEFMARLEEDVPFWSQRLLTRPGITGWAQVSAAYSFDELGAEEKLAYDLWYLRHRSLALDTVICLKTVTTMLTGAGAR